MKNAYAQNKKHCFDNRLKYYSFFRCLPTAYGPQPTASSSYGMLMNLGVIKKHPVFALCLGVTVLLLIATGVGLFLSARLYSRQARALDAVTTRLQPLNRR